MSSVTPWDKVYFRLSASSMDGERWNARNFSRQKVRDALEAVKWLEQSELTRHNIQSVSTAKLCMLVMGVLGSSKNKATLDDFLPFDTRKIRKETGPTIESIDTLKRLMKKQKLDGRLVAFLAEDLKNFSNAQKRLEL